ncbi:MAG TPA: acyl-CoA dehydrogenase [Burkholderiaceae bacterium]|nr:acyl-CoA dehydrogenase [Burkholderiaceae bacterium]
MRSTSKLLSRRDLEFLLYEWLEVESLVQRPRYSDHSRETFDAALDTCERIATEHFYPINKRLDAEEPTFDGERVTTPPELARALRVFCDAGLMAAAQDYDLGGMQLPATVSSACFTYFNAASVSAAAYPFLTIAHANLMLAHGTPEQIDRYVRPMMTGRFFGTMCLSEPQAGSSLSDIRTRAQPQPDGSYRLFGNKMWISAGEHELAENIVHLVLAKIPDPQGRLVPGVKGISLFVVPKRLVGSDGSVGERNDVALAGLNHKMGYRGTTNCLLNFGEGRFRPDGAQGAIGWLVGEPNRGLACMFHMMNEARIGVGLGAIALGYAGYLHSLDYARTRPQGRLPRDKDPAAPQVPIIAHADVRRMLLAQKAYAEGGLALALYCARLVDERDTAAEAHVRERAHWLLELLTPVAKSWPSQWCLEGNSLAIQVHGGYGYTRDYNVEQYYRDNRLNPIHEGTHGIQALDLLGRKMTLEQGRAPRELDAVLRRTFEAAAAAGSEAAAMAEQLGAAFARIGSTAAALHRAGDAQKTLANASVFLEAFGHCVIAWVWLEQALLAGRRVAAGSGSAGRDDDSDGERAFYRGKLQAARYFFRWELPKVGPMLDLLDSLDTTTLDMKDHWF